MTVFFKTNPKVEKKYIFAAEKHSFHLVDSSLYPFLTSFTLLFVVLGIVCTIHTEIFSSISSEFVKSLIRFS